MKNGKNEKCNVCHFLVKNEISKKGYYYTYMKIKIFDGLTPLTTLTTYFCKFCKFLVKNKTDMDISNFGINKKKYSFVLFLE
ncbi:2-iminoacetate synthase ThiH [Dysgonomonas hofstadii]|uniref:2-iminoacetate synthase ThiH n=1 Tax=Dysgonomonas hofstadii TaxID=637886 RepID=A0A840CI80_9BACT|nr:2-iminoacetate synthase ThiH [Dysgonomonas hofstadii]